MISLSPADSGICVRCDSSFNWRRSSAQRRGSSSQRGRRGSSNFTACVAVSRSPRPVDVNHQILVVSNHVTDNLKTLDIFPEAQPANLGLEAKMALCLELLHFVAKFDQVLAVTVIGTGDIAGNFVRISPPNI